MVSLSQALKALFEDVLSPARLDTDFALQRLKPFWHKELHELSLEELAYTLTAMVFIGADMTDKEREKWRRDIFRKNPIVMLLNKETASQSTKDTEN